MAGGPDEAAAPDRFAEWTRRRDAANQSGVLTASASAVSQGEARGLPARSRMVAPSPTAPRSLPGRGRGTPTVRRRRLGSELRRLREAQAIKLEEVAERLGLAASTLSRIETGKAPTRIAYLRSMLDYYGLDDPGQRQILLDMAREGHRKGWWAAWEDVLPAGFDIYVGLEAEAASLRVYEAQVVHGLLQTEEYARAVLTVRRRQTPAEIDRLVSLRMQRQEVLLREDPIDLWLILDEAVIRRVMGPPDLTRQQLVYLAQAAQMPNVTLQVLEFSSGLHPALNGSFAIIGFPERFDPDVVYSEGVGGQTYNEKHEEVQARVDAFDLLRATALPPAESAELILEVARDL
jgi:transcriptional regulator with XRE-family HTH domain